MAHYGFKDLCSIIQNLIYDACISDTEISSLFCNESIDKEKIQIVPVDIHWGDFGTSFPLFLASRIRCKPYTIAEKIIQSFNYENDILSEVSIALNGYINFRIKDSILVSVLDSIIALNDDFGKNSLFRGKKVLIEYVSASPTGPMHIGNLRGGIIGDVLSNLYCWSGAEVIREYFVNDKGDKLERLSLSIEAKYLQMYNQDDVCFKEEWYHGSYVDSIAENLSEVHGNSLCKLDADKRRKIIFDFAVKTNLKTIAADLEKSGVCYDNWFYESDLYRRDCITQVIDTLSLKGYTYKKDGALWLKTKLLLDLINESLEKPLSKKDDLTDDVLIKSDGKVTYFAVDVAYHYNRFSIRDVDKSIDVLGSDQQGHDIRVKIALWALGIKDFNRVEMVLVHMVKLMKDGCVMKMSRRKDYAVTIDGVVNTIGKNAIRNVLGRQDYNSDLNFDYNNLNDHKICATIDYIKYAYLRSCGIINRIEKLDEVILVRNENFELLERELIFKLLQFPKIIEEAVEKTNVSIVFMYIENVAQIFHKYYSEYQVVDDLELMESRSKIVCVVNIVLKNCAQILGYNLEEEGMFAVD